MKREVKRNIRTRQLTYFGLINNFNSLTNGKLEESELGENSRIYGLITAYMGRQHQEMNMNQDDQCHQGSKGQNKLDIHCRALYLDTEKK